MDGQGPSRTHSPPTPPSRPIQLTQYPTTTSLSIHGVQSVASRNSGQQSQHALSAASQGSGASVDSSLSEQSVRDLAYLMNRARDDITEQSQLVANLRAWVASLNPATYQRNPAVWPPQMAAQWEQYKGDERQVAVAHREWATFSAGASNTTVNQIQEAQMAVQWAEAAIVVGKGRLGFLQNYPSAFHHIPEIKSHIDEAERCLNAGQRALEQAQRRLNYLYGNYARRGTDPTIFQ